MNLLTFRTSNKSKLRFSSLNYIVRCMSWSSTDVRTTFINFFLARRHEFVSSSSVTPKKGEGTYFTNAGMNQFKPIFLGECDQTSKFHSLLRAVNSQKCIRVGGKHNDLEDVGHDLTHHTFFEMLGNWSFGDYFKAEACQMAYELLTEQYEIPVDRLYFTYFAGDKALNLPEDEDCKHIWLSLGVPSQRVLPFGSQDNFWDMGVTGPCGPCTEIHYDHVGNRQAASLVNAGSPSVVEIWNLVFMQYNRLPDQSLQPLPKFHVDTGMGLERMTAVLNGTADNYSTDLFMPIFHYIHTHAKCPAYQGGKNEIDTAYRLIADHTRMFTVAISDGVLPASDNTGHKLRSILHRCIHLCRETFNLDPYTALPDLASLVVKSLGSVYPEVVQNKEKICQVVRVSIEHHDKQRELAFKSFSKVLSKTGSQKKLSGDVILALEKGQYGNPVPIDMITELATSHGFDLDIEGFEKLREERKVDISSAPLTSAPERASTLVNEMVARGITLTDDSYKYLYSSLGDGIYDFSYLTSQTGACRVQGISGQFTVTEQLTEGEQGEIILDKTCFYSEAGGQDSDTGELVSNTGTFLVTYVKNVRGYIVHYGHTIDGSIQIGQLVEPRISQERREGCMRNHTATHLLNSALTNFLPTSQQQGSSVTPYKLTFDFLALAPLEINHVQQTESMVRDIIKQEYPVHQRTVSLEDAVKLPNVKVLQNEEYPDQVFVISIGPSNTRNPISIELCCGTHVIHTADIQEFCITQMSSKSQNVKRATCVTGKEAEQAHLVGSVVKSMCLLLVKMLKSEPVKDIEKLHKLISQVIRGLESRQERVDHTLSVLNVKSSGHRSEVESLKEDINKAKNLVDSFSDSLQLLENNAEPESLMRQLIKNLKKSQQLELLPKTVREEAHSCVENMEYKVTELVNKRLIAVLNEMVRREMDQFPSSVTTVVLNDLDINPRQMAKSLSQQGWGKCIVLVKKGRTNANVVFSLPLRSHKVLSKGEMDALVKEVAVNGTANAKLTSHNDRVSVYTISVQGDLDVGVLQACFEKLSQVQQ
ncbi:unnamed protein product [Lymnaea stagnalis]|uniref:Alanine--tRNA ligase n=1 Tax=Lymnaea stagnalis TaxID=6523 RepID=A0AAV2H2K2_LYMST